MSKLQEKLHKELTNRLVNITIYFDEGDVNIDLAKRVAKYYCTDSIRKAIELSFISLATREIDPKKSVIEQIIYKDATHLEKVVSQKPTSDKCKKLVFPKWMLLILAGKVKNYLGIKPQKPEEVIDAVLNITLNTIGTALGDNGRTSETAR